MGVVSVGTWTTWETRAPFKSVGLVCSCGQAVATYEGVGRACEGCGAVYLVTVMVLKASESHRGADSASPPAFADGPVADTAEPVTPQAGIVGAEPDRDDGHTMGHTA